MSDFYCEEVLSGRTPVERVLETPSALAFKHTKPHWAHHIVVIPKVHVASLLDPALEDGLLNELLIAVRHVAAEVDAAFGGCHIATNLGKYQESKHLHFHVGADWRRLSQDYRWLVWSVQPATTSTTATTAAQAGSIVGGGGGIAGLTSC